MRGGCARLALLMLAGLSSASRFAQLKVGTLRMDTTDLVDSIMVMLDEMDDEGLYFAELLFSNLRREAPHDMVPAGEAAPVRMQLFTPLIVNHLN